MAISDDLLKNAANLRDAVIFLASIIYVIGYITWSLYSNYRKLGTVKALDAQYFVIGIPVTIIMILAIPVISKLITWVDFWYQYLFSLDWKYLTTTARILNLLIVSIVIAARRSRETQKNSRSRYILYMMLGFFILVLIPVTDIFSRWITNFVLTVLTLLIFGFVIKFYVTKVYEIIPHNLGGGKFRVARFDLIKDVISPFVLKELVAHQVDDAIVQSRDVTVVSTSDNWILIRIGKIQDIDIPIIEIPRTSIASIVWQKY